MIERAVVVCEKKEIAPNDLSFPFGIREAASASNSLEDVEKAHIQRIINQSNGNVSKAAKILKIDRTTIYNKINKYNLR